jgi:hypothetical protein
MKKLVLIVFALIVSTVAFSQVEKGDISGTANVSFTSQKFKDFDEATNMSNIGFRAGYFFTNSIEAGLALDVTGMSTAGESITTVGWGPYAVYNFLTADAKMLPYVGANFYSMDMGGDFDAINQLGAFGGAKYFLTEAVNVDASLNYTSWLGDIKGSTFVFKLGIGVVLGKLK